MIVEIIGLRGKSNIVGCVCVIWFCLVNILNLCVNVHNKNENEKREVAVIYIEVNLGNLKKY